LPIDATTSTSELPKSSGMVGCGLGIDIYNLMNVDVVTAYNQTFVPGGPWLTPTALQPARYARISAQIDF
jgi:hypothetical protein